MGLLKKAMSKPKEQQRRHQRCFHADAAATAGILSVNCGVSALVGRTPPISSRIHGQKPPEIVGDSVKELRTLILGDTLVTNPFVLFAENTLERTA